MNRMSMEDLRRKYSFGPVPQWEVDALAKEQKTDTKKKTKPKAEVVKDGDGNGNLDTGA